MRSRLLLIATLLALPLSARAEPESSPGEPVRPDASSDAEVSRGFADLSMLARFYPRGDAVTLGASAGGIYRPTLHTCMHVAGELAFERGERDASAAGLDALVLRAALGAMWGRGTADGFWFGAGPMFDLGYARVGREGLRDDGFASTFSLRATIRMRLRRSAFVHADLRIGYTLADRQVLVPAGPSFGITGPMVAVSVGASLGP
jgi:hypothetical protein